MMLYLDIIKQAFLFFPILALLIAAPYTIYNYHKYGSVLSLRIIIVYSFILYLLCAYFLVILPLPSRQEVSLLTGPRAQLIPFHFISDIFKEAHSKHILRYINNPALFQFLFNIVMTIPFGMYLRYYFRCSLKKTWIASFLLSLFFEVTQLTGLYFYYPRSYRLFDLDDLMANTLGGFLGYHFVSPFFRVLPSREQIDTISFRRGMEVSLARRLTAICLDFLAAMFFGGAAGILCRIIFSPVPRIQTVVFLAYFIVSPILFDGQTLGKHLTGTKIVTADRKTASWQQYLIRYTAIFLAFFLLPQLCYKLLKFCIVHQTMTEYGTLFLSGLFALGYASYFIFAGIMMALHKPLFYEKISRTRIISTIRS